MNPAPLVVGLAGGSASGKSTLASVLQQRLAPGCVLVEHDRWYRSAVPGQVLPNFDHPDALEHAGLVRAIRSLCTGASVSVPRYDFVTHQRHPEQQWDHLESQPVIVVDGILLLAVPEVRACLHLQVFVHVPPDIRLVRRLRRDMAMRGRTVGSVLEQYERTVRPMHEAFVEPSRAFAEVVLDGTRPPDELANELLPRLTPRQRGP